MGNLIGHCTQQEPLLSCGALSSVRAELVEAHPGSFGLMTLAVHNRNNLDMFLEG